MCHDPLQKSSRVIVYICRNNGWQISEVVKAKSFEWLDCNDMQKKERSWDRFNLRKFLIYEAAFVYNDKLLSLFKRLLINCRENKNVTKP